jgi:predicted ATPase
MAMRLNMNGIDAIQDHEHVKGITRLTVAGFKSICREQSIDIRPLTILAGANSSGKSSMMQPLLLLKQTLEAPYDPGALLLNGSHVQFTRIDQLLSRIDNGQSVSSFYVGIEIEDEIALTTYFLRGSNKGIDVSQTTYSSPVETSNLCLEMSQEEKHVLLEKHISHIGDVPDDNIAELLKRLVEDEEAEITLKRNRCFLTLIASLRASQDASIFGMQISNDRIKRYIREVIHLPGLRGNPERTYPITAVGSAFPGPFENYVASIIGQWQDEKNRDKLDLVNQDLTRLGLASGIRAESINDTQVELLVKFSSHHQTEDMVSLADVGLGVSQTLPVIVALHASRPRQLIYLEQPELHLHPRAQSALAEVLADAVLQGKHLVIETHSSLLLLGIQTLVAERKLPPEMVKLHWFKRQEDGSTQIDSADLDETGAFGDWPEDFARVAMIAEDRYIDAAEARLKGNE